MGYLGSNNLPDTQENKKEVNEHIIIDTDNFIEADYLIFNPDYYSKKNKTSKKCIRNQPSKIMPKFIKFTKYLLLLISKRKYQLL